jgi:hypothetical protein
VTATYIYRRESNGHIHGPYSGLTKRRALQTVSQSLFDNSYATKPEAQRFAATVPLDGAPAVFGPYTFTITKEGRS